MTPALPGPSRPLVLLLLGLALLPWFAGLGEPPLWDANEPFYASPPKEVLTWPEGDFWAPTFNGRPYFVHPPLSTWIAVPFYALLGPGEFAGRLPMAIAAALTVLATLRLGRLAGDRRTGLLAALVLAATPKVWLLSRQLAGDVYLVLFLTAAFALTVPALEGRSEGRRGLLAAAALVGVGILAKGPVILVLYGGTVLLTWLLARPRIPLASLRPARHVLLALALGAPWFVATALRFPDFLNVHFGYHSFSRFFEGTLGERGPLFYFQVLAGDAQPWLLLLPFSAALALRARDRRPAALLPWLAMLVTVAFFSLGAGKRSVYVLPLYPHLALVTAPTLLAVWQGRHPLLVRLAALVLAVAGFGAAAFLVRFIQNEPRIAPEAWVLVAALLLCGLLALAGLLTGRGRVLVAGGLGSLGLGLLAFALVLPAVGRLRPVPALMAAVRHHQDEADPEPVLVYRARRITSPSFYLGRRVAHADTALAIRAEMGGARAAFVLCPAPALDALRADAEGLEVGELARAADLHFKFEHSVLGRRPSTVDLLLLRLARPP